MAKLVVSRDGAVVDQRFLERERITVGRDPASHLVIDDPAVRGLHAAIVAVGNDYILEDLVGEDGIAVNGTRVQRRILQHGDVVTLGAHHLRFLDAKASSEIDLERTMIIGGLRPEAFEAPPAQDSPAPAAPAAARRGPVGRVHIMGGAVRVLDRVIATFGTHTESQVVIIRRPKGYTIAHVAGAARARVNGEALGDAARPLKTGDVIEVAGDVLTFADD
ncbi:MAG: FHA domain-containing protein [Burkholderiales bacterium]